MFHKKRNQSNNYMKSNGKNNKEGPLQNTNIVIASPPEPFGGQSNLITR